MMSVSLAMRYSSIRCWIAQTHFWQHTRPACLNLPVKQQQQQQQNLIQSRNASHAAQGRANKAAPGPGKRLGAKRGATELVVPGNIIFRQRGTHWFPGEGCEMGRDHTIFAKEKGYVVFYKDKWRGKGFGGSGRGVDFRKYIGVVYERGQTLPRPAGSVRPRRLGLVNRVRRDFSTTPQTTANSSGEITAVSQQGDVSSPPATKSQTEAIGPAVIKMRANYQFRESNWSIGRAAERANVKVREYRRGDRFLAWRKLNARKARAADAKSMRKKGKGTKSKR